MFHNINTPEDWGNSGTGKIPGSDR
jgi:hypothetical protein